MEQVGVEAVVEGLQAFLGDMRSVNGALDSLRPSGTLLQQMFESVGGAISDFGQKVWDVVSVTLGVLLRDAIEGIITALGDLISSIIETGSQFQTLKIRLTGLNLNDFADGTRSFASALDLAGQKTQEEITWLQNLGALTPFDPAQIADTYTQARAFGFTADEAKRLTTDIINFTAAMGLSNETLFLVIQNLGQMVQRGKITGTEIRDLARGSFLPLNDVLQRIAKNMGITVAELTKQISTPAGVPASEFVKAFEQMVEEEPRFVGAAGRLARAFVPAAQNVKELFTSVFGLNTTVPILDILGEKLASIVDVFVTFNAEGDLIKTDKWDALVAAATSLGTAIGNVVTKLLDFLPSGEDMADVLINSVQGLADWIDAHQGDIIGFFKGIADTIANDVIPFIRDQLLPAIGGFGQWVLDNKEGILGFFTSVGDVIANTLVPFVRDQLVPAFEHFSAWVDTNKPTIDAFFSSLGEIITTIFNNLTGGAATANAQDFVSILDLIKTFMQFVIDNKDTIAAWGTVILAIVIAFQILATVLSIVIGIVAAVVGVFLTVIGVAVTVGTVIALLLNPIGLLIAAVVVLAAMLITNWAKISTAASQLWFNVSHFFSQLWTSLVTIFTSLWTSLVGIFSKLWSDLVRLATNIWTDLTTKFNKIRDDIKNIDWWKLGNDLINGIGKGITDAAGWLAGVVTGAVMDAYNAALKALGISSPSKLFAEIGAYTMEGFAQGVQKYANVAAVAMSNAMQRVAAPVVSMPGIIQSVVSGQNGTVNNTSSRNYNLTVNSAGRAEPIVQDFNMMVSLAG